MTEPVSPGPSPDEPSHRPAAAPPRDLDGQPDDAADSSGVARPRLTLGDPLTGRAAEDRPESWGDRTDSEADRLAHYLAQRPPHHGS